MAVTNPSSAPKPAAAPTGTAAATTAPRKPAPAPTAKPPGSVPEAAPSGSLFDVLTDRDLKQAQANPYAPTAKSGTSDAAALRTYIRDDDAKKAKSKTNRTNLILLTVAYFIGVVKNGFIVAAMYALAAILPQLAEVAPFIRAGAYFLGVLAIYAVFDLVAAIGLIMRKPWGWWFATIGLGWAIAERIMSFVAACFAVEDQYWALLGPGLSAFVFCSMCASLVNFMLQTDVQQQFGVTLKGSLVWPIVLLAPLAVEGAIFGVLNYATNELEQAIESMPVPNEPMDEGDSDDGP